MQNNLKYELYNVISGKSEVRFGTTISAIAGYLNNGAPPSATAEDSKQFKIEEAKRLENGCQNL